MSSNRTLTSLAFMLIPAAGAAQVCGVQTEAPAQLAPQCAPAAPTMLRGDDLRAPYGCGEARVLFVDIPTWMPAPTELPMWGGHTPLRDRIATEVEHQTASDWFCPEGVCGDACRLEMAAAGVHVEVDSVLPDRPLPGLRGDGHLRFWRIRFLRAGGGYLALDPWAHCEALQNVRSAVTGLLPDYGVAPAEVDEVRVGREACAVQPMAAPTDWHTHAIGAAGPAPAFGLGAADRPHLALVDTGVEPAIEAALDVQSRDYVGMVPEPSDPNTHRHGAAMADLIRQLAPQTMARVTAYRVMDGGGVGVVGHVARAVDAAIQDDGDPLVVNLSLGWLPEYERRRTVYGDACQTREDGVGEALRYVLTTAREADDPMRPVLVVSAAGNRPLSGEKPEFHDVQAGAAYDACTTGWWDFGRPPMLMPAEWSRTTACTGAGPLALAVGAVDANDTPSALSIAEAEAETALVAPGQHVHAPSGAQGGSSLFTGTSVASALTAGVAARTLARLVERWHAEPWLTRISGHQLGALLYLAGINTGRDTYGWVPVRRLHAGRLDQLLGCQDLDQVLACVAGSADFGHHALLADCGFTLWMCGLWDEWADPEFVDGDTPEWARGARVCATAVPAGSANACDHWVDCTDPTLDVFFGPAASAGDADRAARSELGGVGPQPHDPPCPDCGLARSWNGDWSVSARFNGTLPAKTQIENPYLLLTLDATGKTKRYFKLAMPNDAKYFSPGQKVKFTGLSLPWFYKAQLLVTVDQPNTYKAWDVSPLWVKW